MEIACRYVSTHRHSLTAPPVCVHVLVCPRAQNARSTHAKLCARALTCVWEFAHVRRHEYSSAHMSPDICALMRSCPYSCEYVRMHVDMCATAQTCVQAYNQSAKYGLVHMSAKLSCAALSENASLFLFR